MRRFLALPVLALLILAPAASAAKSKYVAEVAYPGMQRIHYRFGPVAIIPGQNTIDIAINKLKPHVDGYITRFKPDLTCVRTDRICHRAGEVPRVDVIHLHHGVWLARGYPTFAAGEEKTIFQTPRGYGYRYGHDDRWLMNYMIHNLTNTPTSVYIDYTIDFVPATAPAAKSITEVKPLWMDVAGISAYPVFDVHRGWGHNGRYTFPNDARGVERTKIGSAREHTFSHPITLVGTAGHLHPGGLWTDLKVRRGTQRRELFRSQAHYFEPAGAVSWDVSMTGTKPNWKIAVQPGDTLGISATYDSKRASWYEVMGIMVLWYADGRQRGAVDPFTHKVDWHGLLTHGHLAENRHHGGESIGLPDARSMPWLKPFAGSTLNVAISDFIYGRGDLNNSGRAALPPVIRQGQSLTFKNLDNARTVFHTITACRAPCTGATGIAYPLADGPVTFDSAELGTGPPGFTAASNRITWQTPKGLKPGTYNYFCRIHPFMRGAFRVIRGKA